MKTFGEFVRNLRLQRKLTLREFCREHNLEPANWSRMERGVTAPPQDRSILERYARNLSVKPETEDWRTFMDLAAIDSGVIPEDIMNDELLLERVPVMFRAARGDKLTREQLDELLGLLRKETKNVHKKKKA
jgi:transcriptional regulator with XRE-family HTH domain